jgi:hypothetical protein
VLLAPASVDHWGIGTSAFVARLVRAELARRLKVSLSTSRSRPSICLAAAGGRKDDATTIVAESHRKRTRRSFVTGSP